MKEKEAQTKARGGITKASNDNTCKTQSLNLREHLEGSLISLPPQCSEAGGCVYGNARE